MSIEPVFKSGKQLIPYLTAGDPNLETTAQYLDRLAQSRIKIVELGIPFSDPLADGPVIQASHQRAIASGSNLKKVFSLLASKIPADDNAMRRGNEAAVNPLKVILMLDFNLVFNHGIDAFAADCKKSGVAGVLVPNLPLEDVHGLGVQLKKTGIAHIHLVSHNTPPERLKRLAAHANGFLYVLSTFGVTGARDKVSDQARDTAEQIKKICQLPLCVGFGISRPDHVKNVWTYADGAIVGSALVEALYRSSHRLETLSNWIHEFNP